MIYAGIIYKRVKHSGVNSHSSVVREHQNIVDVEGVRLAISWDQLDVSNLLCFELLIRRLGQLEVAVGRWPSSPDFTGLDMLLDAAVSEGGSANTKALDAWVTERLKERANKTDTVVPWRGQLGCKRKGLF